jgi:hypothetical protein
LTGISAAAATPADANITSADNENELLRMIGSPDETTLARIEPRNAANAGLGPKAFAQRGFHIADRVLTAVS